MNSLLRIACCVFCIGLFGCATSPQKMYKTRGLSQCQQVCVQHLESCQQNCTNNCRNCQEAVTDSAATNFFNYANELQVQGGYINRRLKSYRDPLQCRKVTCNCAIDFNTCNQACTGIVQKKLKPLPYCP